MQGDTKDETRIVSAVSESSPLSQMQGPECSLMLTGLRE